MFQTYRIGSPFGVEVRVHGTVLALAAVVALVNLLASGLAGAATAVLVLVAVFASVTLHELGHIGASALFGGRTLGVTLYPFGGVARLDREARSGVEEVVVALAGPAVNFVLAGLAGLPLLLLGPVEPLLTLAAVNVGLGLFNLVPAFPMDGGRVLRGALWGPLGWRRATGLAARAGRWFALGFAVLGLLWNPMLLMIAVVVFLQASATLERLRLGEPAPDAGPAWAGPAWTGPAQTTESRRVVEAILEPDPRRGPPAAWPAAGPTRPADEGWVLERVRTPWGVVVRWSRAA